MCYHVLTCVALGCDIGSLHQKRFGCVVVDVAPEHFRVVLCAWVPSLVGPPLGQVAISIIRN